MKYLILDSGSLINFSSNSLLSVFEQLKKIFPGEFLITKKVKHEVIDHPLKVKRFEWGALRIQDLLDRGIIKLIDNKIVNLDELNKRAEKIMNAANNTFQARKKPLHIIDLGEAEVIALSQMLTEKDIENTIVIDERTARILCEKPENLQKLLKKKLHTDVKQTKSSFDIFKKCKIIRSTELAYIAYKKGFIKKIDKRTLEAVIYALKFGGVSISEKEVQMFKKMG